MKMLNLNFSKNNELANDSMTEFQNLQKFPPHKTKLDFYFHMPDAVALSPQIYIFP